jgi:hypothetical protein
MVQHQVNWADADSSPSLVHLARWISSGGLGPELLSWYFAVELKLEENFQKRRGYGTVGAEFCPLRHNDLDA